MQLNLTKFQNILTNAKAGEGGKQFDMTLQILSTTFGYAIDVADKVFIDISFTTKRNSDEYKIEMRLWLKDRAYNLRYPFDMHPELRTVLGDRIDNAIRRSLTETVKGEAR